ncbi:MAG: alpha/beta fold hydrolase [Chloroflexi bacterium]|nr:alpha/beta fold hydrolase [Chloroflexota bacterium]
MTTPLPAICQGAEPFFHRGSGVGCLVLHGFMASPAEIRWLCHALADAGHTVFGPRLPGHGTNHHDMTRVRWQDWYTATLDGYHLLRSQCEQVFVAGHSMGGVLALLVGAAMPVNGLAVLAAPAAFRSRAMRYAHLIRYVLPYTNQRDKTNLPQIIREEQARRGEPTLGRVRYDLWSSAAVSQLYRLTNVMLQQLPRVTAPLLLVYSQTDRTVPPDNMDRVASRVGSSVVTKHCVERSDHILIQDVERDLVFQQVTGFIHAHSQPTQL